MTLHVIWTTTLTALKRIPGSLTKDFIHVNCGVKFRIECLLMINNDFLHFITIHSILQVRTRSWSYEKNAKFNVLIIGLKGLGLEIAKNVILAGESKCHDLGPSCSGNERPVRPVLLEGNGCWEEKDQCSLGQLADLNTYVPVKILETEAKGIGWDWVWKGAGRVSSVCADWGFFSWAAALERIQPRQE